MGERETMINILIADDDPDDQFLIKEALEEAISARDLPYIQISLAENGEHVLEILNGNIPQIPMPDLIILDLNMPRLNGIEALRQIKSNPKLRHIQAMVLTTSRNPDDIAAAYHWGASGFISKPISYDLLVETMRNVERYWIRTVELPPRARL